MLAVRVTDRDAHPESPTLLRTMVHRIAAEMIGHVLEAEVEAYVLWSERVALVRDKLPDWLQANVA